MLFAAGALGYGLYGLHVSGTAFQALDLIRGVGSGSESLVAVSPPLELDPRMNPLRAVLVATHAPLGSSRWRYEVVIQDESGVMAFRHQGFLGSSSDEASAVLTRVSLGTFDVSRHGRFTVRARTFGSSMDDLRELKLELRRNVMRVDARLSWGLGLAALACLIANLLAGRRALPLERPERESPRRVA